VVKEFYLNNRALFFLQFSFLYLISLYFMGFFQEQAKHSIDLNVLEENEVEAIITKKDSHLRRRAMNTKNILVENVDELYEYEETNDRNSLDEERKDV